MIAKSTKKREPKQLKVVDEPVETVTVPWCLEDADFEDVADFDEALTDETRDGLVDLGVMTMGAVWEYAVNSGHEEILGVIEQYCDRHPEAPRPAKQPATMNAQAEIDAWRAAVEARQVVAEMFIIYENAKEAAKVAKEAYEASKTTLLSLIRERHQEIVNPQGRLF